MGHAQVLVLKVGFSHSSLGLMFSLKVDEFLFGSFVGDI
jgi:hypothetical protein